ncbi:hypothetical protein CN096_36010 [Sinorhizobium meliloti]|nr:hypothetical protein CN096_36010 [Sinorhizobium meliloti]
MHRPLAGRRGWIERSLFADACASLWIDGALVHPEDLFGRRDLDHQRVMTPQPAGSESAAMDVGLD